MEHPSEELDEEAVERDVFLLLLEEEQLLLSDASLQPRLDEGRKPSLD